MVLPVHTSYPMLIDRPEAVYCVPETAAAGEVALHRATEFPRAWVRTDVLLEGVAGVDSTLFTYEDRWLTLLYRDRGRTRTQSFGPGGPPIFGGPGQRTHEIRSRRTCDQRVRRAHRSWQTAFSTVRRRIARTRTGGA